ncbi:neuferricin [Venturia canescens]|uniref:neuferricin n=1 Tax=Venturia canescens TaxID=32260 RepID=UPI001C9CFD43|nr:neuferricin [Venturia canescens]
MEQKYVWFAVLLAICYQLYTNEKHRNFVEKILKGEFDIFPTSQKKIGESLITDNELKKYNNLENGLYLSIIGNIFDVTAGAKHYGPGATYHLFTGRDASLAFVTGEFEEGSLSDDISSLSNLQLKSIKTWIKFYNENYIYKGKLIGRYYDKNGNPTTEYETFEARVKLAEDEQNKEEEKMKMFPPCNVEWKVDVGTRVWCTQQSGGISREWAGVPRKYFEGVDQGKQRCACVNLGSKIYEENEAKFREYDRCPKLSESCTIPTHD